MTFEAIYREHFAFVWRTLQRMGVSARDLDDACQKVFLVAFRRLAEFEGRSTIRTWLCGIALRTASDYRRSAIQRRERLTEEEFFNATSAPSPLDDLAQRERLRELDAVLSELPLEQRTVLVLFELEELSGQEIAQILGVPEGTIRSRLRLAREAFARISEGRREGSEQQAVGGSA